MICHWNKMICKSWLLLLMVAFKTYKNEQYSKRWATSCWNAFIWKSWENHRIYFGLEDFVESQVTINKNSITVTKKSQLQKLSAGVKIRPAIKGTYLLRHSLFMCGFNTFIVLLHLVGFIHLLCKLHIGNSRQVKWNVTKYEGCFTHSATESNIHSITVYGKKEFAFVRPKLSSCDGRSSLTLILCLHKFFSWMFYLWHKLSILLLLLSSKTVFTVSVIRKHLNNKLYMFRLHTFKRNLVFEWRSSLIWTWGRLVLCSWRAGSPYDRGYTVSSGKKGWCSGRTGRPCLL